MLEADLSRCAPQAGDDPSGSAGLMRGDCATHAERNANACLASASATASENTYAHGAACANAPSVDDAAFDPSAGERSPDACGLTRAPIPKGVPDPRAEWFEQFWSKYLPIRNCAKARARKVFLRVAQNEEVFARIMGRLEVHASEWKERPTDRCPYAASWLNSEDWERDEPEPQAEPIPTHERLVI
jgi:hypothetical protein